jgi:hypothetical protein
LVVRIHGAPPQGSALPYPPPQPSWPGNPGACGPPHGTSYERVAPTPLQSSGRHPTRTQASSGHRGHGSHSPTSLDLPTPVGFSPVDPRTCGPRGFRPYRLEVDHLAQLTLYWKVAPRAPTTIPHGALANVAVGVLCHPIPPWAPIGSRRSNRCPGGTERGTGSTRLPAPPNGGTFLPNCHPTSLPRAHRADS